MGRKTSIESQLIIECLKRFPDTPTLTLAKKIYKEHSKIFKSIEFVRWKINYYRGKNGIKNKKHLSQKGLIKEEEGSRCPFNLPESHAVIKKPFKLPTSIKKVLVLSDIHFPFQDNEAITAALKYGKKEGIDCIFLNGDILDMYSLSFHEKDPRKWNISLELEMGREFLKMLRKNFSCPIYFIPGNHEIRIERYLRVKAPELLDIQEFKLDVLLRMREHDVIYLEHSSKVYFGKLLVEHGDKMKGSGGVNPARTLLQRFKRPTMCGHFHRTSTANGRIYDGDGLMAWSLGCLCGLEPDYMELNEWNHGGAIVDIEPNGNFRVNNFQIINGKVY